MKFSTKALALAVLSSTATMAMAEDNALSKLGLSFSGSAAVTNDYRFRGMTQTASDPAVQAGFTLSHTSGLYVGLWGSNVNFGESDPHLELDPSIGFTTPLELSPTFKPTLDVGVVEYNYPSASSDFNWTEFYAKLIFADVFVKGGSLLINVNYTNDWAAVGGNSWNFNLGYSAPFGDTGFGGVANVGYTTMDEKALPDGKDNYVDWKVGVNYSVKSIPGVTAELAAVGTNIDTDGFTNSGKRAVETGAVFTLTKAF
ncbi:TorF family putative porin [Acinetobacter bereziniae]|uniref:TorF family putative porin n=1 Tax=Acinetobacter bereziniae TaxID=106648 RepID=UPI00125F6BB4|nr:TorF family putative porin [Acinetobacter bereziniae]